MSRIHTSCFSKKTKWVEKKTLRVEKCPVRHFWNWEQVSFSIGPLLSTATNTKRLFEEENLPTALKKEQQQASQLRGSIQRQLFEIRRWAGRPDERSLLSENKINKRKRRNVKMRELSPQGFPGWALRAKTTPTGASDILLFLNEGRDLIAGLSGLSNCHR